MTRMDYEAVLIGLMLLVLSGCEQVGESTALNMALTPAELNWVGEQVFHNECSGQKACLVHWNEGEAFPSLGIGHFIWYPAHVKEPFVESFPALISFMRARSVPMPAWLGELEPFDAPWPNRNAFHAVNAAERVSSLREFLWVTRGVQAEFIVRRGNNALERVIDAAPEARRVTLRKHLGELVATPGGAYAVIDYVNFKGEGLSSKETYQGQGWGLLQVLLAMPQAGDTVLTHFRLAAKRTLTRRAENAPRAIERQQWLPGWLARIETYREPNDG